MIYSPFVIPDDHPLHSILGAIWCAADASNTYLTGIYFAGQRYEPNLAYYQKFSDQKNTAANARVGVLSQTAQLLQEYFANKLPHWGSIKLGLTGTAFQKTVWDAMTKIPYGQTVNYSQIAQQIGKPRAVRAVGGAIGRNPYSILIPCHRVIGSNGELTGYAGGIHRKKALLHWEGLPR